MTISGAWLLNSTASPAVPLDPGRDTQHITPDDAGLNPGTPKWVQTAAAPDLPSYVDGGDPGSELGFNMFALPLDNTPWDHHAGVGGSGLQTPLEVMDTSLPLHTEDLGAVAEHRWTPAITIHSGDPRDGYWHVAEIPDMVSDGESPRTNELQRAGVGAPEDGGRSRLAKRQRRWRDRYIDMHRSAVVPQPDVVKSAKLTPAQPAVADGGSNTSPFATSVTFNPGSPDRFVRPQMRRSPQPWDQASVTDGINESGTLAELGGTTWGL